MWTLKLEQHSNYIPGRSQFITVHIPMFLEVHQVGALQNDFDIANLEVSESWTHNSWTAAAQCLSTSTIKSSFKITSTLDKLHNYSIISLYLFG